MSHRSGLPSHIRPRPSSGLALSNASTNSNPQASALQARIAEKKVELESLRQLRDLSAGLAAQMQQLEEKLATLGTGTEAVAAVLGNWNQVLRAVYMASSVIPKPAKEGEEADEEPSMPLPQTLVRIPIQQAEAVQKEAEAAHKAGE
ncbi:DASH complex subunit dad2 [Elasticomyces elasticus]|nr:DASH complex subunit dad2 [Elasticomyces elasticus]